jgi:hypothetical protein
MIGVALAAVLGAEPAARAESWLPIDPAELAMTAEPKAPKAPAIYLYRQVDRDDNIPLERQYIRIKVLTDEGRRFANIDIDYDRSREWIHDIEARTIRPDGSIMEFKGTVYDKTLVEAQGSNLSAKSFQLPAVEVGSIIEYRWSDRLAEGSVYDSRWVLSGDLFTKSARFSLIPSRQFPLRYSWPLGLPAGTNGPIDQHGTIHLDAHDVPAFVREDHMPPEDLLKYRVEFIYVPRDEDDKDPDKFWKKVGKADYRRVLDFIDEPRVIRAALAEITSPADAPEVKLHKIYARVAQFHDPAQDAAGPAEAEARAKHRAANVAEVWRRGYGSQRDLDWLFLALVRAAGLHADPVLVPPRDRYFFDERFMNPGPLGTEVVAVTLNGTRLYLDPGADLTPFGSLPWRKTGVQALRLDKDGGDWINTPAPKAADSRASIEADLNMTPAGALAGKVTLTCTGNEARRMRVHERREDAAHRRQYLEQQMGALIAARSTSELEDSPDWTDAEAPFVASFRVSIPEWVSVTGKRALLPRGLFAARIQRLFEHATRVHPIYFNYPFELAADTHIALPGGWSVDAVPADAERNRDALQFRESAVRLDDGIRIERSLHSEVLLLDVKFFDVLRGFYDDVRSADAEPLVLGAPSPVVRH